MRQKTMAIILLALCLLTLLPSAAAAKEYTASDAAFVSETGVTVSSAGFTEWNYGAYVGFRDVDFTGMQSIVMKGSNVFRSASSGETFDIRIDSPTGKRVSLVHFNSETEKEFRAALQGGVTGVHDLYILASYSHSKNVTVTSVSLSKEPYEAPLYIPVPETAMIDNFADTWTATDSLGRRIADFEEAGPVKEDKYAGIFYWIWHINADELGVQIPSQIIAAYPEAKDDYYHPAWEVKKSFWSEPLLGFYSSWDYWVYRKHAVMLKNAGIDTLFLDFTNLDNTFGKPLAILNEAFRDARASGVDAPKICFFDSWAPDENLRRNMLKYLYYNYFMDGRYSDLWFYWEGKPLLFGGAIPQAFDSLCLNPDDPEELLDMVKIEDFFTYRPVGVRKNGLSGNQWLWLDRYPQLRGNVTDEGTEAMAVGVAINYSYVKGDSIGASVFSDPYTEGRAYSEAFGEDYRPIAAREAWFFREQASRALDVSPKIVLIDGWNEWTTGRQMLYNGYVNAFVDTFDDENSRDFEPSAGYLGDDFYNLLVDFVRKFKGVRPAPTAQNPKTIDIFAGEAAWENVGPLYLNDADDFERDVDGYQPYHYTTKVVNSIQSAKVSFDQDNLYFMVKTRKDIVSYDDMLSLYLDIDRNRATGWEGFDLRVKNGAIERFGVSGWEKAAEVTQNIAADVMTVAVPRALAGETGVVDFNFKWVDGCHENGDILAFYKDGSAAPMGRFTYLYTQIEQQSLSGEDRAALSDVTLVKAGSNKAVIDGARVDLYEPDTRVVAFTEGGTAYVPASVLLDALGYGRTKVTFEEERHMLKIRTYELEDDKIGDVAFVYMVTGSYAMKFNGQSAALSAPVIEKDGLSYVPLTLFADAFGYTVTEKDGVFCIAKAPVDEASKSRAAALL